MTDLKYSQQDIFKVASQIETMEEDGNSMDIKVKGDKEKFKKDLIAVGISEEDFLQYINTHKNYDFAVITSPGGHWTEVTDFFYKVERQLERIKLLDSLHRNGGVALNDSEKEYCDMLTAQAAMLKSKSNSL